MPDFSDFDSRRYRTVDVRTGYGEWVATYEDTVEDAMDVALLDRLERPAWSSVRRAADLGCGTGRTGAWLRRHGVDAIDGVDVTPEMLAVARATGVYDRTRVADVAATGLDAGAYGAVVTCLVDEHLAELGPLYLEAARIAMTHAWFVVIAYHPHFIMATGMPTHYDGASGEPIAITTHVHLISEHVTAGLDAGWTLREMREGVIDDRWIALKPKWERFRGHPVSVAFAWQRLSRAR